MKHPTIRFKHSLPHSDQTNVDVTSLKNVTVSKRGNRFLLRYKTTNDSTLQNTVLNSANNISQNGVNERLENILIQFDDASNESTNGSKSCQRRRLSGLPLVNRKMTAHDTILLETYRTPPKRKPYIDNDIACGTSLLSKQNSGVEVKNTNSNIPNGHVTDIHDTHFDKIDEGFSFEECSDV